MIEPIRFPEGIVLLDGHLTRPEDAQISVFDRAVLYGDSVFETMRAEGDVVLDVELHLERFQRALTRLGLAPAASLDAVAAEIEGALRHLPPGASRVRLTQTRGVGPHGVDPRAVSGGRRIVFLSPIAPARRETPKGVRASILQGFAPPLLGWPEGIKHGNYLHAVRAVAEAQELEAARARDLGSGAPGSNDTCEPLLADPQGELREGATANLLWVRGGRLEFPRSGPDVLAGITQRVVLELAASAGMKLQESRLMVDQLQQVEELFVTSSLRGLVPIVSVDATTIGTGRPGPLFQQLDGLYWARAEAYVRDKRGARAP